jgi:hypothetical protein
LFPAVSRSSVNDATMVPVAMLGPEFRVKERLPISTNPNGWMKPGPDVRRPTVTVVVMFNGENVEFKEEIYQPLIYSWD